MNTSFIVALATFMIGASLLLSIPTATAQSPDQMCRAIIDARLQRSCFDKLKQTQAQPSPQLSAGHDTFQDECIESEPERRINGCTQIINDNKRPQRQRAGAFYNRALAYQVKLNYERAIADYNEAIRLGNRDAFNNRGNIYLASGDFDRAIADYNEAIRLNPNASQAFYNRGTAYSDKNDYDHAIADLTESIRLNPIYVDAFRNRGNAYDKKADYRRAIDDFTQVIRLNQNDAPAYVSRAFEFFQIGDRGHALADLNEAIQIDPTRAVAFYNRGMVYRAMGDTYRSNADLTQAARLDRSLGAPRPSMVRLPSLNERFAIPAGCHTTPAAIVQVVNPLGYGSAAAFCSARWQKVKAGNGAIEAVDLNTISHIGPNDHPRTMAEAMQQITNQSVNMVTGNAESGRNDSANAMVCSFENGACNPSELKRVLFNCSTHRMADARSASQDPISSWFYAPPRSVGGKLLAIVCSPDPKQKH